MSISALSSNLVNDLSQQQRQNPFAQMRQDFNQLASTLQSGDLSGAQTAYSKLAQLVQGGSNNPTPGTTSTAASTIVNDFATLGQALQSGDVGQAQSVFAQLEKDLKAARQPSNGVPQVQDQYVPSAAQQTALIEARQVQQDYSQLHSSLQSGDLLGAQAAFASLQEALQAQGGTTAGATTPGATTPGATTPASTTAATTATATTTPGTSPTDVISNDFNALGAALASNNLTQAQGAFSQLQNDIQTAQQGSGAPAQSLTQGMSALVKGHHHHHHHGGGGESSTQSSTSTTTESPASSGTANAATGSGITINIYG
jgi:hypothetical protein